MTKPLVKLRALYDVLDIYGNVLVKAKQQITSQLIKIASRNLSQKNKEISLIETEIIQDMLKIITSGIYNKIFQPREKLEKIMAIAMKTRISTLLLHELVLIKQVIPTTYNHILAVAALSIKMSFDLPQQIYDPGDVVRIGLAHDLGKSRIPQEILEKKGPLTHYEFSLIQMHPLTEFLLICHYLKNPKSEIAKAAFSHHERKDGSGYPRGIRNINKYAQILIPCDIFDSLINHRPYRNEPYTVRAALDLLLDESRIGKINKKLVVLLISYVRKEKPNTKHLIISTEKRDLPPLINYYGIRVN